MPEDNVAREFGDAHEQYEDVDYEGVPENRVDPDEDQAWDYAHGACVAHIME